MADWEAAGKRDNWGRLWGAEYWHGRNFRGQNDKIDASLSRPWPAKSQVSEEGDLALQAAESQAHRQVLRLRDHREQCSLHLLRVRVQERRPNVPRVWLHRREKCAHVYPTGIARARLPSQIENYPRWLKGRQRAREPRRKRNQIVRHGQLTSAEVTIFVCGSDRQCSQPPQCQLSGVQFTSLDGARDSHSKSG